MDIWNLRRPLTYCNACIVAPRRDYGVSPYITLAIDRWFSLATKSWVKMQFPIISF